MSLRYRIAAVIFLLEAIMMAAVLWGTLGYAVKTADEQIAAAEQVTLNIVSRIGRIALLNEDYDRIQGYIEALLGNPGIVKAMLSDDRNIIVASNILTELGEYLPHLNDTQTLHWRIDRIGNISGDLGMLAVQFSDEARQKAFDAAMQRGISIAAIGMAAIAIVGIGIGFLLTSRLERLTAVAEQVSQGNFSIRASLKGRDEIAQVGAAFDSMTETIAAERKALANTNQVLETRVKERTLALEESNREHKLFAHAISHDLRAPLRSMAGFSQLLTEDYADKLDENAQDYLGRINKSALKMGHLIEGLLKLSRINQADIHNDVINLSSLCDDLVTDLRQQEPERKVDINIAADMITHGDKHLLRDVMANLIGNAWKYSANVPHAKIRVGARKVDGNSTVYFVEDNGAGFNPENADKLFTPFQRLHTDDQFAGTGIGLSTVQRIVHRHHGSVWAMGNVDQGATFYFTLNGPRPSE